MIQRLGWFAIFFVILTVCGGALLDHGSLSLGTVLGSLISAVVIAAIIQPKK